MTRDQAISWTRNSLVTLHDDPDEDDLREAWEALYERKLDDDDDDSTPTLVAECLDAVLLPDDDD